MVVCGEHNAGVDTYVTVNLHVHIYTCGWVSGQMGVRVRVRVRVRVGVRVRVRVRVGVRVRVRVRV